MAAAAAMAEEAASGSTGSSGLCSRFTMTEHSLCPSTHAPWSTSREGGGTQAQGAPRAGAQPRSWPLCCTGPWRDVRVHGEAGGEGRGGGAGEVGGQRGLGPEQMEATSSFSRLQSGLGQQTPPAWLCDLRQGV